MTGWNRRTHAARSWIPDSRDLAFLVVGFVLLFLAGRLVGSSNPVGRLFSLITGSLGAGLVVWGAWKSLTGVLEMLGAGLGAKKHYRVTISLEALAYMVIMCVLVAGALFGKQNLLVLVFALMGGPFVLNGQITYAMLQGLDVVRKLPTRAVAGEPFSVTITIRNRKRWFASWVLTAIDHIAGPREELTASILFLRIPRLAERSGEYQLRLAHRGRYEFGPLEVVSRYPLGLMERGLITYDSQSLIVFPRIGRILRGGSENHPADPESSTHQQPRKGTFDDDFHRLRKYQTGDNPRAIHWRSSARRNELMVREYHQQRERDLAVVLDLFRPNGTRPRTVDRFVELAVSYVATLCVEQAQAGTGRRLWLHILGTAGSIWEGTLTLQTLDSVLERLALAEADSHDLRLADLSQYVAGRQFVQTMLVSSRDPQHAAFREFAPEKEPTSRTKSETSSPLNRGATALVAEVRRVARLDAWVLTADSRFVQQFEFNDAPGGGPLDSRRMG